MLTQPNKLIIAALLGVLLLGYLTNQWMNYQYIYTDSLLLNLYLEKGLPINLTEEVLNHLPTSRWRFYTMNAVLVVLKISVITVAINSVQELYNSSYSIITNFYLVICSEYIGLVYQWVKLLLLLRWEPGHFQEILTFAPFSLFELWSSPESNWWFVLGALHIFQLIQLAVLVLVVHKHYSYSLIKSITISSIAYLSCLFIWLALTTSIIFYAKDIS